MPDSESTKRPPWRSWCVWALATGCLLAVAASVSLLKIRSFDYWWHLRTGAWIAEHGAVPHADLYTYTVRGQPWLDVHWLFQLGLHTIQAHFGHEGVVVAKLVLVLAWLGLMAMIGGRPGRPLVLASALALALIASSERIMPRPELPTMVLLAAVLLVLERARRTPGWLAALIPLQLLWANMHGLYAVGIGVVALHLAGEAMDRARPGRSREGPPMSALLATLVGVVLVTLLNPAGFELLLYPLKQLAMIAPGAARSSLGRFSVELRPLWSAWRYQFPLPLACLAALAGGSFASMVADRRRLRAADALVWLALLGLALIAVRNEALFATAAAPALVRHTNGWLDARAGFRRIRIALGTLAAAGLLLLAVAAVRGTLPWRVGPMREAGLGILKPLYPIGAADWIAAHHPPGPLYHHMADGGYLIWRLYPEVPVLWDGRLEVFGPARLARWHGLGVARFERLDRQYHFGTVLLHYAQFDYLKLIAHLRRDPRFRLVFADDVAVVFVRLPEGARFPALDPARLHLPSVAASPRSTSNLMREMARTRLYSALGLPLRAADARAQLERDYPNWRSGHP